MGTSQAAESAEAAPDSALKYIALGDSYASGEGTYLAGRGGYIGETDSGSHRCHRAQGAWNTTLHLYASNRVAPLDVSIDPTTHKSDFIACSGATTNDLETGNPNNWNVAQIGGTKTSDPDFITLSIGGNDADFAKVVEECYVDKKRHKCGQQIAESIARLSEVQNKLVKTYVKTHNQYSRAAIFVVGYPQILGTKDGSHRLRCLWLNPDRWDDLRGVSTRLNGTIKQAVNEARANGVPVTYVDIESALAGHELCTGDSYVRDVFLTGGKSQYSAHPAPRGQAAISKLVGSAVGTWAAS